MSRDARARLRNQRIGFVFQNFNLLARTSAVENVELPLLYASHIPSHVRRKRAVELLEKVKLGGRLDHHPGQLSGGEQQRVALARALVNRPSILLADEPTGNVDSRTSREILELFLALNEEENITIILVTHDQEVGASANRSLVLRDGKLVADTTDFAQALQALHTTDDHLTRA